MIETGWLEQLSRLVWGRGSIFLVLSVGLLFTVGTGFLPLRRCRTVCGVTVGSLLQKKGSGVSPFAAMSAALGGTMGVGNIIGVGAAMELGGAGAIFWMWIGALTGMMTKYAEVLLAVRYREKENGICRGGPMYYMTKAWGGKMPGGKALAVFFSGACILGCLTTGNMTQTNAISRTLSQSLGIPGWLSGIGIVLLCGWVSLGGSGRIVRVSAAVVPAMALLYLGGSAVVLWQFRANLLPALGQILQQAFTGSAALGGGAGVLTSRAVQVGISRGIFTNEAGLGSAPIAHACAETKSCVEQGMWGIFEVFVDTILVCTVTALVVLASGVPLGADASAAAFTLVLGEWGGYLLAVAICFFAIASVFSWSLYGQRAVEFLFPGKPGILRWFHLLFLVGCFSGSVMELGVIWLGADVLNACLMLPNLVALVLLCPIVLGETRRYFSRGAGRTRDQFHTG